MGPGMEQAEASALPAALAGEERGWRAAAAQLRTLRRLAVPMAMRLEPAGEPPITIDLLRGEFEWAGDDARRALPAGEPLVRLRPVTATSQVLQRVDGLLPSLLWRIGLRAFGEQPAEWLLPGEAYRLAHWPNLTEFAPQPEQIQICALLAETPLSLEEAAEASGVPIGTVGAVVSALSLMGLVEAQPAAGPGLLRGLLHGGPRSLFRLLRDRLGV